MRVLELGGRFTDLDRPNDSRWVLLALARKKRPRSKQGLWEGKDDPARWRRQARATSAAFSTRAEPEGGRAGPAPAVSASTAP